MEVNQSSRESICLRTKSYTQSTAKDVNEHLLFDVNNVGPLRRLLH